jgi:hypothetical protein
MTRIKTRRGSNGWIGVLVALSAAVLPATAATAATAIARSAGGLEAAQADSRCAYRVYAPTPHYVLTTQSSEIVAGARFRCTTSHRNATATVVMERFSSGKWSKVASRTRRPYLSAGVSYVVQAKWRPTSIAATSRSPR